MINKTLIAIVGPTAIGKTALAIGIAKAFDTEIISADSRQFFKEMCIGTAVPSKEELSRIKHHFIQHISIVDHYSVGDFEKEAIHCLNELFKTKDVVVLVGGSGLYVDAITKGLDSFPTVSDSIKKSLENELKQKGIIYLQQRLKELDPSYYYEVDLENPMRVLRALGVCLAEGKPYSSYKGKSIAQRPFNTLTIGIEAPRPKIYQRIEDRVDIMINEGLVQEAESLYPYKNLNALNTVGYKELFAYMDHEYTLDTAIGEIKKNTRRFAKRQGTWFRKNQNIRWVNWEHALQESLSFLHQQL